MTPHHAPSEATSGSLPVTWADPQRAAAFEAWLASLIAPHQLLRESLRTASADASFRRYLRIDAAQGSRIIMDAPPDKENCQPFVQVAQLMKGAGLHVPDILAWDEAQGFMLLTDLGSQTMMQAMKQAGTLEAFAPNLPLYQQAVDALITWQTASQPGVLPAYDEALLRRELSLFPDWYIAKHRGITLSAAQSATLQAAFDRIVAENLRWPAVYVHRDFMPRNLMMRDMTPTLGTGVASPPPGGAAHQTWNGPVSGDGAELGVLDFQDAVYGPITYDIASLMRDAFLSWDEEHVLDVTIRYWQQARKAGLPVGDDFGEFYKGVEWMGLQRHLKVAGIFARLTLRDGKPQYLADAPRFIAYIRATCSRYIELKPLLRLVEEIEGIKPPEVFAFGRS